MLNQILIEGGDKSGICGLEIDYGQQHSTDKALRFIVERAQVYILRLWSQAGSGLGVG